MTEPPPAPVCPYCLAALGDNEEKVACPACHALQHAECWHENGGCAVYGCTATPVVENRAAIEVPVSFWGREQKPCPSCGQGILAAALRCRHCGAMFASARPEDATEFQTRALIAAGRPAARRTLRWIFVLSIIPFTAPIAAGWGWWWHRQNRDTVFALSALDRALGRIGLIASFALTAGLVVLTALYIVVRER